MPVTFEENPGRRPSDSSYEDVDVNNSGGVRMAELSAPRAALGRQISADAELGAHRPMTPRRESLSSGEETFLVQVVNAEGEIETVPVKQSDHDENFDTNRGLLGYLAEQGELLKKREGGQSDGDEGGLVGGRVKRRGSLFPEALLRRSSKDEDELNVHDFDLDKSLQRLRSGSIMTPTLVQDLKKNKKRIVSKKGVLNIALTSVSHQRNMFLKDFFNSAIDMQWRLVFAMFFASFFLSWFVFGIFYWLLCLYHGDLEMDNLPSGKNQKDGSFKPCIWAIEDFTGCFLFSVETQHTIGYGSRQTTEECPLAVILMCVQSVIGVIISACQAGIIFAKLARPKARAHTIQFSRNAVITMRDGALHLLFRVGNLRRSQLLESHVRAQLIQPTKITEEGEFLHFDHDELIVSSMTSRDDDRLLLHWPMTVSHRIDRESPFYRMGPKEILNGKFEILVTLEGIVESTGNSVQSRSSYLPNEILWGHRFYNLVTYSRSSGTYIVDCSNLNSVQKDLCTPAKSMRDIKAEMRSKKKKAAVKIKVSSREDDDDDNDDKKAAKDDSSSSSSSDGKSNGSSSSSSDSD